MVEVTRRGERDVYRCEACGLQYADDPASFDNARDESRVTGKEWAEQCEAWCREHKSCNLEIIQHAIKDEA